jgi:hypothetical protein
MTFLYGSIIRVSTALMTIYDSLTSVAGSFVRVSVR